MRERERERGRVCWFSWAACAVNLRAVQARQASLKTAAHGSTLLLRRPLCRRRRRRQVGRPFGACQATAQGWEATAAMQLDR